MKTKILTLLIIAISILKTNSQCSAVYIPNTTFKTYLLSHTGINLDGNGDISCAEAEAFTGTIDVRSLGITNLTGIGAFTNITQLWCHSNALTSLNVSNNTDLRTLMCFDNPLDVSNNNALTRLECNDNNLYSLKLTNGNSLNLNAARSSFKNNPNLSCIYVDDVAYANTNWTDLKDDSVNYSEDCDVDCIVNIPDAIFKNSLLKDHIIDGNNDNEISCAEAALYNAIIQIPDLDITDLTGIEAFVNITDLDVSGNELTSLNISSNITYFNAGSNPNLTCIQVDDVDYATNNFTNIGALASFNEDCSATANVVDTVFNAAVNVYPNPVHQTLNINLTTGFQFKKATIYNLLGKEILSSTTTNYSHRC